MLENKIQVGDLIQVSLFERPIIDQAYVSAMEKKKGKNKITDDTQEIFPLRIPDFFLQPQEKLLYFSWPGQDMKLGCPRHSPVPYPWPQCIIRNKTHTKPWMLVL